MKIESSQITRIPYKYLEILKTQKIESVWKLFINILWWNEELDDNEMIFFNLIMTDVNNINHRANEWIKGWRPKKEESQGWGYWNQKPMVTKNDNLDKISKDKTRKEKIKKNILKNTKSDDFVWPTKTEISEAKKNLLNWLTKIEKKDETNIIEKTTKSEVKMKYGNSEINEILETIKNINEWIIDWTQKEQRQYWKLLLGKLNKIKKVKSWAFTPNNYLYWLLELLRNNKYCSLKINWPKNIFYNLAWLIKMANESYKSTQIVNIPVI